MACNPWRSPVASTMRSMPILQFLQHDFSAGAQFVRENKDAGELAVDRHDHGSAPAGRSCGSIDKPASVILLAIKRGRRP
jgi:hypothetical protein